MQVHSTRDSVHTGLRRLAVVTAIVFCVFARCNACPSRRSPPPCSPRDCTYTSWGPWSSCTAKCGYVGIKKRTRSIRSQKSCGGTCHNRLSEQLSCPNICCPNDCRYTWLSWSACDATCGYGTRTRKMRIDSLEKCGGKPCPSKTTETSKCGDGR